ncbi:hypothetical protein K3495_g2371 [Podosphaera aphanis]|nr:hypothetical protein K3495_g2371 [Podosphaera aphanis]
MTERVLNKKLHIQYWQRCLKSLLPTRYTGNDSSRMTLGFFILSALDLLHDDGSPILSEGETHDIRNWVLQCQHPHGGFCGSPNHRYPDEYYTDAKNGVQEIDPANLPATFFAILSLGFVGDLKTIDRKKCLRWLRSLQREDGSFGELVTAEGKIWGGRDMRYCYVATAIWWMLRGYDGGPNESIDVQKLMYHIKSSQTYDGGISESSQHEAHAGYTFCAIAALSFLSQAPNSASKYCDGSFGLTNLSGVIHWLVSRQVNYEEEDEENDDEDEDDDNDDDNQHEMVAKLSSVPQDINPEGSISNSNFVGFNGRCNKTVDTCYIFWVTASLDLLGDGNANLVNNRGARRFLLEQTQHRIGGFGKSPGDPPGIHSSVHELFFS